MNGNLVPVLIVALVMFMIVMKARYRYLSSHRETGTAAEPAETAQLKNEVRQLKDRINVLERIVTDKPSLLAQEIDRLSIDNGGRA